MLRPGHCRCCGIGLDGQGALRMQMRVCIGCDNCDGLHGDVLQGVLRKAVMDRKLDPGIALARALIDDAQLTGRTHYVVPHEGAPAEVRIPSPPPRWLVVCGRALARGEQIDLHSVVGAVLERHFGRRNTSAVLEEIRIDLRDALSFVDPSIFDVEVSTKRDAIDPENLVIEIKAKTPTIGAVVSPDADAVIPPDIMSRPRAEA